MPFCYIKTLQETYSKEIKTKKKSTGKDKRLSASQSTVTGFM